MLVAFAAEVICSVNDDEGCRVAETIFPCLVMLYRLFAAMLALAAAVAALAVSLFWNMPQMQYLFFTTSSVPRVPIRD